MDFKPLWQKDKILKINCGKKRRFSRCYKKWFQSSLLNLFPHTTNLQQTTLKTFSPKYENSLFMKEWLLNKVKYIVANGELLLLPQCFQESSAAMRLNASIGGKGWRFVVCGKGLILSSTVSGKLWNEVIGCIYNGRCKLLDFHTPSGPDGTHPKLFQWVKEYFEKPAVFRPPLYLQHQGKL